MNEEILINVTPQETRVAVMQSGVAQELHIELASIRGLVGNIYMGKVARVLPGMQSAFVEIGLERAAFLHVADIWEERQNSHGNGEPGKAAQKPIEKILAEGQPLLVQVVKDPIGTKGARLSTQVSIAGRMLVYLPQDPHIGISQRIEDESGRQMLRDKVQQMLPADEKGGFIIRTMAETATDAELLNDLQYLRKLWQDLRAKSLSSPAPALLHQDLSLAQRVLRDFVNENTDRILIDSRENFLKMQGFARDYMQNVLASIDHYTGERPQFELYNVEDEIDMETEEHRAAVLAEFNKALARDRTRMTVSGFTQLGLVEMTRKRTRESLAHVLCESCPTCGGRGEVKAARTVCYEILREILRESRQFNTREFRILAAQVVIDLFLEDESQSLAMLEDFIGKPVSIQAESSYSQEQFDIVLL